MSEQQEFRRGTPGVVWKNDRLYFFRADRVMVLQCGSDPRCWIKSAKNVHWHSSKHFPNQIFGMHDLCRGADIPERVGTGYRLQCGQMVMPFGLSSSQTQSVHLQSFINSIPPDIRTRVMKFSDRRWQMYNLLARVPGSGDLCDSNPALAWALANSWVFKKNPVGNPVRSLRSLVYKKQTEILRWLDFPSTNQVRRILSRIDPADISVMSLFHLRTALSDPYGCKLLSHMPRTTAAVIWMISELRLRPFFSPAFYIDLIRENEFAGNRGLETLQRTVRDAFDMAGRRNERIPVFKSVRALSAFHDRLSGFDWSKGVVQQFPDPPFAGTETIIPVRTAEELYQESRVQQNCCAAYGELICGGDYFIYRAEIPLRVTIGIKRQGQQWQVDQIFQARNRPVPEEIAVRLSRELLCGTSANDFFLPHTSNV